MLKILERSGVIEAVINEKNRCIKKYYNKWNIIEKIIKDKLDNKKVSI